MKHKTYTKEEVETFLEDDYIDFEDEEMNKAIKTIATKQLVILEVGDLPKEDNEERAELIIKIKLVPN